MNGMKFLPRLLDTLRKQREVETEIIVVDRESRDGSRYYLAGMPDIRVVTEPAFSGLAAGYHTGSSFARHDLLFFCNEDVWLHPDCLSRLARHISLKDRIGAADPWQWSYDGARHIHAGTRFFRALADPISCYPPRGFDFLAPLASGDRVPFGCAGAFLMHRQMYRDAGGWDTSFFLDFEDVDLFLRAWQRSWGCVSEPEAKVYHAVGMSAHQTELAPQQMHFRRRVHAESNRAVVCLKYFTGPALLWTAVLLFRPLAAHAVHFRWRNAQVYIAALRLTWKRLPSVRAFRQANRIFQQNKPGQQFFTERIFQRCPGA